MYKFAINNTRKVFCRRSNDRRRHHYEFGTQEWIDNLQLLNAAWPRQDRRTGNRRQLERRKNAEPLVSFEESKFISGLYNNE